MNWFSWLGIQSQLSGISVTRSLSWGQFSQGLPPVFKMQRLPHGNCWYGFSTIGGDWGAINFDGYIESSIGRIELPVFEEIINGESKLVKDYPLFLVGARYISPQGWSKLLMGGQSQNGHGTLFWTDGIWYQLSPLSFGQSPCAFSQDGRFFYAVTGSLNGIYRDSETGVITPFPTPFYVDGIRAVIPPSNKIILGNTTIYSPVYDLHEYIDFENGLVIGQGASGLVGWYHGTSYLIEPGGTFFIRAMYDGFNIALATVKQTERQCVNWFLNIDELITFPHAGEDPIAVIGKPCWVGWFEFNNPPSSDPPGNGMITVRWPTQHHTILRLNGSQFANWIEGVTVEEIEEKAFNSSYPALLYWDGRDWPHYPSMRPQDWLGLQMYCHAEETIRDFEANMRAWLNSIPVDYKQIAVVAQCYTSNENNTKDLKGLVPVYSRLARDYPRVNFLAPFSDQGRATGLNDHPEVRPYWERLFAGVTGEPTMDTGIVDGVLVDPRAWWLNVFTAGEDPANFQEVMKRKEGEIYKWGLGQQNNSGGVPRGRLFLPWNLCPNASPQTPQEFFLGVNQTASCCGIGDVPCKKVDVVDQATNQWIYFDRDPHIEYQPIGTAPGDKIVIQVRSYTNPARRSDPDGCEVKLEIAADNPCIEITISLNDGDQDFVWTWTRGKDGRYFRILGFKVTVEGNWTLTITAKDNQNNHAVWTGPITVIA